MCAEMGIYEFFIKVNDKSVAIQMVSLLSNLQNCFLVKQKGEKLNWEMKTIYEISKVVEKCYHFLL